MSDTGVLPREHLEQLLQLGYIQGIGTQYLNPSSIDLPIDGEAYQLGEVFLPRPRRMIRSMLTELGAKSHDLQHPLERGKTYLLKIAGTWQLPRTVYGYANPKSSSGRIGISVRIVADRGRMFDALEDLGWNGDMWALVRPEKFPILAQPGIALSQLRLFDGKSFLSQLEIELAVCKDGLLFEGTGEKIQEPRYHRGSLLLSIKVANEQLGWRCRVSEHVLNLSRYDHDPDDFFEPFYGSNEGIIIDPDYLYILPTCERVKVPPEFCAELREIEPRLGKFASHAAGFIDSGWGCGSDGKAPGQQITLEIIPYEVMRVTDGQIVARIRYERMIKPPEVHYGTGVSNYVIASGMGAGLAKFFKKK